MAHYHVLFMKTWFCECLRNSLAVNLEQFLMQITHKSKPDNNTGFFKWPPLKPLWSVNADLKFSGNNGVKYGNKKPAGQRENRLAPQRQRRQQEAEETTANHKHGQRHRKNTREQLLCIRNRWREGRPTAYASRKCCKESDEESEHLKFTYSQKWKLDARGLPCSVIEVLLRYVKHYGIIMHTSYLPTGQRSRLK